MIERPRGTKDYPPEEMARRRQVESKLRDMARRFGFGEVLTPTFEHVDLFIARSGPSIVEELYEFKDKGGRRLALRPEITASVVRFYLQELRGRKKPLKFFYFQNCFRYERPQAGRYREFFHFGAEIIGGNQLESDGEIVALAVKSLKECGLQEMEIRIGHIGILRSLIPLDRKQQASLLQKLDKKEYDEFQEELASLSREDLYDLVTQVSNLVGGEEVLEKAESLLSGTAAEAQVEYLSMLGERLKLYGISDFQFDFGVVRGLDYYSGMVFEIDSPRLGAEKQICGGGSYELVDVLAGDGVYTTGFAIGFDRVMLALEAEGVELPLEPVTVYVIPIGDSMRGQACTLVTSLRDAGIDADIDLVGRGPTKNLDYANSIGAKYAVLIGEEEWSRGNVALKDMSSGEQVEVSLDELIEKLSSATPQKS